MLLLSRFSDLLEAEKNEETTMSQTQTTTTNGPIDLEGPIDSTTSTTTSRSTTIQMIDSKTTTIPGSFLL